MVTYLDILNSEYFYNTYSLIEEMKKDYPVNHGFVHVNHVLKYARTCVKLFDLTPREEQLLYIAVCLHDIGYLKGRREHAYNGSILAREYLMSLNIDSKDIDIICNAIANHGGKKYEDLIEPVSMCLAIADKLDFTKERYTGDLTKYEGMSEYAHILSHDLNYDGKVLNLEIYTSDKFCLDNLKDEYISGKLNKFLELVSKRLGCEYKISYVVNKNVR